MKGGRAAGRPESGDHNVVGHERKLASSFGGP
jgi:hypothetical protein